MQYLAGGKLALAMRRSSPASSCAMREWRKRLRLALAQAIVAMPFLVARTVSGRLAERQQSTQGSVPIARAIAQADPS